MSLQETLIRNDVYPNKFLIDPQNDLCFLADEWWLLFLKFPLFIVSE